MCIRDRDQRAGQDLFQPMRLELRRKDHGGRVLQGGQVNRGNVRAGRRFGRVK